MNPQTTAGTVLDVLTGKASIPPIDFNVEVENATITKMALAVFVVGIVLIVINRLVARVI